MKKPAVQSLTRDIVAPAVQMSASTKGNLLYEYPLEWIMNGVFFDWVPGGRFYLNRIAQAVYVPEAHIVLSVGTRLIDPRADSAIWFPGDDEGALGAAIMSAIDRGKTTDGPAYSLADYLLYVDDRVDRKKLNPLFQEQLVFGHLILGYDARIEQELEDLIRLVRLSQPNRAFEEVGRHATAVKELLQNGTSPLPLFEKWKRGTVSGLLTSN